MTELITDSLEIVRLSTTVRFRADRQTFGTTKHLLISAFIVFHLISIICWAVPLNTVLFTAVRNKVAPYMFWSGLYQSWGLFAPNPTSDNSRLEAEITFTNGQKQLFKFPLPQNFGYMQRYAKERHRKWANDALRMDSYAALWPDAARYIARLNKDLGNPPVTVKLIRNWSDIPAPGSGQAETWHHFMFFNYSVTANDLADDRAADSP